MIFHSISSQKRGLCHLRNKNYHLIVSDLNYFFMKSEKKVEILKKESMFGTSLIYKTLHLLL